MDHRNAPIGEEPGIPAPALPAARYPLPIVGRAQALGKKLISLISGHRQHLSRFVRVTGTLVTLTDKRALGARLAPAMVR